jgi:hypothetical protein
LVAAAAAYIVLPSLAWIIVGVISCIPWGRGLKAIDPGLRLALLGSRKAICTTAVEFLCSVGGGCDPPLDLLFGKLALERFLFRTEVRGRGNGIHHLKTQY